jgi:hypothetical protein
MVHDLQFAVDRMDNTQFEHHDFNDTSASEEVKEARLRGAALAPTPSNNMETEERSSVKVGNKRGYQEMASSSNPVVINEQSNPSIK